MKGGERVYILLEHAPNNSHNNQIFADGRPGINIPSSLQNMYFCKLIVEHAFFDFRIILALCYNPFVDEGVPRGRGVGGG